MSARRRLPLLAAAVLACWPAAPARAAEEQASVAFGVYIPKANERPDRIDAFSRLVGRTPAIVSYYKQWDYVPFDPAELGAVWNRGAVPMITWEPLSYEGRSFPLDQIQRGRFDRYIRESARAAAAWGRPILVRFAHEMNGSWYPWARGAADNNSYRIKAVWRRVVRIFREWGATNVDWVWTPNVNTGGSFPFRDLYPGDEWVDWVGFDGFNWALRGEWHSFTEIVDNTYEEIAKLTSRPMIAAETGSSESGGDKAAWVASALRREIPKLPRIRAVVWFSATFADSGEQGDTGLDTRVNSSPESLRAFRRAIASPLYGVSRSEFLATPADYARGPIAAPAPPDSGYGQPSLFYRLTQKLHGRYLAIAVAAAALALLLLIGAAIALRRIRRRRAAARQAPA
ncbi:MAG TPA: glycosyl hydrolase [Solirubrobacterales bacterium]|nr:glycosyl hydrolase [Solirubrobacterales bacterium]